MCARQAIDEFLVYRTEPMAATLDGLQRRPFSGNCLIYEAALSGHHETYLTELLKAVETFGYKKITVVLHISAVEMVRAQQILVAFPDIDLKLIEAPTNRFRSGFLGLVTRELWYWRSVRDAVRLASADEQPEIVFMPYLDYCLYALAVLGRPGGVTAVSGIAMRPAHHFQAMGVRAPHRNLDRIKALLLDRLLKRPWFRSLICIDPTLRDYYQRRGGLASTKVHFMPDPADFVGAHTRSSARKLLGIADESIVVLVYGAVTERKGLAEILHASARDARGVSLIVAGQCAPAMRSLLGRPEHQQRSDRGQLIVMDRRLSSLDEQMVFASCDAVWLGYVGHYTMSGVLVKALIGSRAVLATQDGLIGWYARREANARVFDLNSESEVAAALSAVRPAAEQLSSARVDSFSWATAKETLRLAMQFKSNEDPSSKS